MKTTNQKRKLRDLRVKKEIKPNILRPRLSVFRSNKYLYAQIIDDQNSQTLASASNQKKGEKITAAEVGEMIAQKASKLKIKTVYFDRGRFRYHGKVKELAESARKKGLKF